jgi:hypothetical protein
MDKRRVGTEIGGGYGQFDRPATALGTGVPRGTDEIYESRASVMVSWLSEVPIASGLSCTLMRYLFGSS